MEPCFQGIVALELQRCQVGHVAFKRADPALVRQHNGNGFTLHQRLCQINRCHARWDVCEGCAPLADLGVSTKLLAHVANFPGDGFPLLCCVAKEAFDLLFLLSEICKFLAQLHFFELAQLAQPRVKNGFSLQIRQFKPLDQRGLGLVFGADNADDFIKVQECNQQTAQAL